MDIGGFIAVNSYLSSMFAPLNYLGMIYQSIIQGMIDVRNLCDLLSESPDVVDQIGALPIPLLKQWLSRNEQGKGGMCDSLGCEGFGKEGKVGGICRFCGIPYTTIISANDVDEATGKVVSKVSTIRNVVLSPLSMFHLTSNKRNSESSVHGFLEESNHYDNDTMTETDIEGSISTTSDRLEKGLGFIQTKNMKDNMDLDSGVKVEFSNITFHYPEQPPEKGLKGVNFVVQAGTTTAIVGHTGAGKTTISRLLFRFYDPLEGSVRMGGYDIKQYTQKSVRQCIGIVPQDTVLFNDSILHNLKYGRMDATMEEVEAAAEAAQIKTFIESLPDKWETMVGERGLKLSGGEKQRVAIARCLLKNPPVVLLDEATSALDTATEQSVQQALEALGKKRTLLVIAHRLSTIRNAHQIVVMDGKLTFLPIH